MGKGKTKSDDGVSAVVQKKRQQKRQQQQQQRLKREDCHRTKHDSAFSKWQMLIGSSDWEDHRLGKDGAERYRIANLPSTTRSSSCPGIYELGVAHVDDGRELRKLGPQQIIVVYLGQADNVRTRLQHYGRAGSHLGHHNLHSPPPVAVSSTGKTSSSSSNERWGFFQDVFARGFSIVFRWSAAKSKREAEEKEALLLRVFDYAWNKIGNGCCRRDDILLKLNRTLHPANPLDALLTSLKLLSKKTRVGIDVDADADETRIFKFLTSRPRLICGPKGKDWNVCTNRPPSVRKKSQGSSEAAVARTEKTSSATTTCGVMLEDGSACTAVPSIGRKRCQAHKGMRVKGQRLVQ